MYCRATGSWKMNSGQLPPERFPGLVIEIVALGRGHNLRIAHAVPSGLGLSPAGSRYPSADSGATDYRPRRARRACAREPRRATPSPSSGRSRWASSADRQRAEAAGQAGRARQGHRQPAAPGKAAEQLGRSTGYHGAVARVTASQQASLRPSPGASRNAGNSTRLSHPLARSTRQLSYRASSRIRITSPARPAPRRTAIPSAATDGDTCTTADQIQGQERGEHIQQQIRDLEQHEPANRS